MIGTQPFRSRTAQADRRATNAWLDLIILPAFLAASSVGLYSVATNVSGIVIAVAGALAALVLPAAARHQEHSARIVVRSLHATVLVGSVLALAIALVAPVGVRLVYGPDFVDSVSALWLLLPGCVLIAAAVLTGGLSALNRPFASALAQVPGICVTLVALLLFLESGGIDAAALVSSVSYATIFVAALVLYRRASGLSWRDLVPTAGDLGSLVTAPVRLVGTRRSVTVPDRRLR